MQMWISGSQGVEPRTSAPALPCFTFCVFPHCPRLRSSARLIRSVAYQGYAVMFCLTCFASRQFQAT